jgi:hypothetical protein
MTRHNTLEMAIASDIYCKWNHTDAVSWILHKIATYFTNIKFLMLLVKSNIFGTILNTENMRETNVNRSVWNRYKFWFFLIMEFSIKPSRDATLDLRDPDVGRDLRLGSTALQELVY